MVFQAAKPVAKEEGSGQTLVENPVLVQLLTRS